MELDAWCCRRSYEHRGQSTRHQSSQHLLVRRCRRLQHLSHKDLQFPCHSLALVQPFLRSRWIFLQGCRHSHTVCILTAHQYLHKHCSFFTLTGISGWSRYFNKPDSLPVVRPASAHKYLHLYNHICFSSVEWCSLYVQARENPCSRYRCWGLSFPDTKLGCLNRKQKFLIALMFM